MLKNLHVGNSPLTNRIYAGTVLKDGWSCSGLTSAHNAQVPKQLLICIVSGWVLVAVDARVRL